MKSALAAIICAAAMAFPALADDGQDKDEAFDDAVREFGYNAGAALQCTAEPDRPQMEREVLKAFNGLSRLFGTDQAFFFAAAFGAGTQEEINKSQCPTYIQNFTDAMKSSARAE
jgi:hypothetical protein